MAIAALPASGSTDWYGHYSAIDAAIREGVNDGGIVQVESFAGADDGAKMTAALSYAAAQSQIPWVQLPARTFNTGAATYSAFTGMKIMGAGHNVGPKNLEISSGAGVIGKWQTSCGNGAASLIQATGTVYDWIVSGVAFHGGSSSQIFRSTVNSYACQFDNLTFYGCKHAFGSPAEKFLMTQVIFSGHWTNLAFSDTQYTVGGGDCQLWVGGFLNMNSPAGGAGKPMMVFDGLGKSNIGYMYLTAEGDWVGLRVTGAGDKHLAFFGGVFEGRSQTNVATRPVIDVQGAAPIFYAPFIGQVDSGSVTVDGCVHQSGGRLVMHDPLYYRGSGEDALFPLLYQTGGTAHIDHPIQSRVGEQIRIRWSTGTTATVALPVNEVTA